MIKVIVNGHVYHYDNTADVYYDYPNVIYRCGYFIAYEEEGDDKQ